MALFGSLFKRKSKTPPELAFAEARGVESGEDEDLLKSLLLTVRNKQPLVPAMCLIAYENVFLVRAVFERIAASIPGCS